ncbi:MAG TPA: uracil-DNA glycosylase, partial [Thermoanaerobaculia bacterium]|nr:uracil-DNA glycosylase [Thermoanaerobaculia bacterium]
LLGQRRRWRRQFELRRRRRRRLVTSRAIERFVASLSKVEVSARACNQFSRDTGDAQGNAIRRRNLRLYLEQMTEIAPRILLIGEAVSYRGGRLTGIAFVSESLMLSGVDTRSGRLLGADRGYRKATPGARLSTEASATMVWGTIRDIAPLPLLWNAFPFHPFHEDNPDSNRAPSAAELLLGQPFIESLLRLFDFEKVVAIGNSASLSLQRMNIAHTKVRHPSQGGKNLFVEGMSKL